MPFTPISKFIPGVLSHVVLSDLIYQLICRVALALMCWFGLTNASDAVIRDWRTGEIISSLPIGPGLVLDNPPVALDHPDFRDANLEGTRIFGALTRPDFAGANLVRANLEGNYIHANFTRADLSNALLTGEIEADWTDAKVQGIRFLYIFKPAFTKEQLYSTASYKQRDLRGIDFFYGFKASGWNFDDVNLEGSRLYLSVLDGTSFRRANLSQVLLDSASMNSAQLDGAKCTNVQFTNIYASDASFRDADLTNTTWKNAGIARASFERADLTGARMEEMNLRDADFSNSRLGNVRFHRVTNEGAKFLNANMANSIFTETDLSGANFTGATLQGTKWVGAKLAGARFDQADLSLADLTNADLTGASFHKVQLGSAQFQGTRLLNADFTGANFAGFHSPIDLTGAVLNDVEVLNATLALSPDQLRSTKSYRERNLHGLVHPAPLDWSGIDLSEFQLARVDWSRSVLRDSKLVGSNLSDAKLRGTDLSGTDLQNGSLTRADLTDAKLENVNLTAADLTEATLVNLSLTGARLQGSVITGAKTNLPPQYLEQTRNYSERHLQGLKLLSAQWQQQNLDQFRLDGMQVFDSNLERASLQDVTWNGATMERSQFAGVNLDRASLTGSKLTSVNLQGATLRAANLTGGKIDGSDFGNAQLDGANLRGVTIQGTNLSAASLQQTDLSQASFVATTLTDANFTGADIREANLNGATRYGFKREQLYSTRSYLDRDLHGVSLQNAILDGWDFQDQNLQNAAFDQSSLRGARFTQARLKGARFQDAALESTSFRGANLHGVDLANARITSDVDFSQSVLQNATLGDRLTRSQIYSSASYKSRDLRGVQLDLRSNEHQELDFTAMDLSWSRLDGRAPRVSLTHALVRHLSMPHMTKPQLERTSSYQMRDLRGIAIGSPELPTDFADWNFREQDLRFSKLTGDLRNADLNGAVINDAQLYSGSISSPITITQLMTTKSYENRDLGGLAIDFADWRGLELNQFKLDHMKLLEADLRTADLQGSSLRFSRLEGMFQQGNLRNADLFGASLRRADLTDADLLGAEIRYAELPRLTESQFISTASYQNRTLHGVNLHHLNLTGWSFANQDLEDARFTGATIASTDFRSANLAHADLRQSLMENSVWERADLRFADLRDAVGFIPHESTKIDSTIFPDGRVELDLNADDRLRIVDASRPAIVDKKWQMTATSTLELVVAPAIPQTQARVVVPAGTHVELGGTLRVALDDASHDPSLDEPWTLQLFRWDSLPRPGDVFDRIELPAGTWDVSDLYSSGTIVLRTPYTGDGDFDLDGVLAGIDIDRLSAVIRTGIDFSFDVNRDRVLSDQDRSFWITELANTGVGDSDLNGAVEFADFLLLSSHFNQAAGWSGGDFTGDGIVLFDDFLQLSERFGSSSKQVQTVPEPNIYCVLSWSLGYLGMRNRAKRAGSSVDRSRRQQRLRRDRFLFWFGPFMTALLGITTSTQAEIRRWDNGEKISDLTTGPNSTFAGTLRFADLQQLDLKQSTFGSALLTDAKFDQSDLSGSRLGIADFSRASFQSSNLASVDGRSAIFDRANFRNANLSGAQLGPNFDEADFSGAKIDGAILIGLAPNQLVSTSSYQQRNLAGVQLLSIDLTSVDLSQQNLQSAVILSRASGDTSLEGSDLSQAQLTGTFTSVDFRGSTLTGGILSGDFSNSKFDFATLSDQGTSPVNVAGDFRQARFDGADLTNVSFQSASVLDASFKDATIQGARLSGMTLPQLVSTSSFRNKTLENVHVQGDFAAIELTDFNLRGTHWSDSNLANAKLLNADLTNADFSRATLSDAVLTNAVVAGASLPALSPSQIYSTQSYSNRTLQGVNMSLPPTIDLTRQDLTGAVLQGTPNAILQESNLSTAKLRGDFTHANFAGANLTQTDFSQVEIRRADFSNVTGLNQNQFRQTTTFARRELDHMKFVGLDLQGWDLSFTSLVGADFSQADLRGTSLLQAKIDDAIFTGSRLQGSLGVSLTLSQFISTVNYANKELIQFSQSGDWSGIDLHDFRTEQVDLSGSKLTKADLSGFRGTEFRARNTTFIGANLEHSTLTRADFSASTFDGANLSHSNLDGANLISGKFENANLENASLIGANLTGSTWNGANLRNANLQAAILDRSTIDCNLLSQSRNFGDRNLSKLSLVGTNLSNCEFFGFQMDQTNLTGANLSGSDLIQANLALSNLTDAKLDGTHFVGADIQGINLTRATRNGFTAAQLYQTINYQRRDLRNTTLIDNDLSGWNFSRQKLDRARLDSVVAPSINMSHAQLNRTSFGGANLQGADFSQADLTDANFFGANLKNARLSRATGLKSAILSVIDRTGIQLDHTDLSGMIFDGQNWNQASLSNARLDRASFRNSNLLNADFTDSTVEGVNWSGSNLTQQQLYSTQSYQERQLASSNFASNVLKDWNFDSQNLRLANFSNAVLDNTDFRGADLTGAKFSQASLTPTTSLENATIRGVSFDATSMTSAQLYQTASYRQRDLRGVSLRSNSLTDLDLSHQDLSGATIASTTLKRASFRNANLTDANLSGAVIDNADFSGAIVTGALLPVGLSFEQLSATQSYLDKNLRRIGDGTRRINFVSFDLHEQDLTGANLRSSDLTMANLRQANLTDAQLGNLTQADLTDATIRGSQLVASLAQIQSTDSYKRSDLEGVQFLSGSVLSNAPFSGMNLRNSVFAPRATLSNVDFSSADLRGARFQTELTGVNLTNALIDGASFPSSLKSSQLVSTASYSLKNLVGVSIPGISASGMDLNGHDLSRSILTSAVLNQSKLTKARLAETNLTNASLIDSDLTGADLSMANLNFANLTRANLSAARLSGANLSRTNLSDAITLDAEITNSNFLDVGTADQLYQTANYRRKDLKKLTISRSTMADWSLRDQDLSGSKFVVSNLTGADLTGATITDVDFSLAPISEAQFSSTASYQTRNLAGVRVQRLDGWNLRNQILTGATLGGPGLAKTDFSDAQVERVTFLSGSSDTAKLSPQQLYSTASYRNRSLLGLRMSNQSLEGWDFSDQDLTGADFSGAFRVQSARFVNAIVAGSNIPLSIEQLTSTRSYATRDLHEIQFNYDFTGRKLDGFNLSAAKLRQLANTSLRSADLRRADLQNAILTSADLRGADLRQANLRNADVLGANFVGTRITQAVLPQTFRAAQLYATSSYQSGQLQGTSFTGDVSTWDFHSQNLTGAHFEEAKGGNLRLDEAHITGANFSASIAISAADLYQTASYQERDLRGLTARFTEPLHLQGQNLMFSDVASADHIDYTGADLRHALIPSSIRSFPESTILPNGHVSRLKVAAGETFLVRDVSDQPLLTNVAGCKVCKPETWMPIIIDDEFQLDHGTIQIDLVDSQWDSTLRVQTDSLQMDQGILDIRFASVTNDEYGTFVPGATFQILDWGTSVPDRRQFAEIRVPKNTSWKLDEITSRGVVTYLGPTTKGDFNLDGILSVTDLQQLQLHHELNDYQELFDLDGDQSVNGQDVHTWVTKVFQAPVGDANLDREVNFSDFLILSSSFGAPSAAWQEGDFDGSGEVEFADFLLLSTNFGQIGADEQVGSPIAVSDFAHVPEPSSVALLPIYYLLIDYLLIMSGRRRRPQIAGPQIKPENRK